MAGGVLLGMAQVAFVRSPGFYRAEVSCQELPTADKGKAPVWKLNCQTNASPSRR